MNQLLQLLCSIQLITRYVVGQCYYCSNSTKPLLKFAFRKDAPVQSSDTWAEEYLAYYEQFNTTRFKIWQEHFNKVIAGGS
jgi:hypothetical protein